MGYCLSSTVIRCNIFSLVLPSEGAGDSSLQEFGGTLRSVPRHSDGKSELVHYSRAQTSQNNQLLRNIVAIINPLRLLFILCCRLHALCCPNNGFCVFPTAREIINMLKSAYSEAIAHCPVSV